MTIRMFIAAVAFFFTSLTTTLANEIPGSCMVSFNIKAKSFNNGFSVMNCKDLESRRLDLFQRISALPTSGTLDVQTTTTQLASLETQLKAMEDKSDWGGWAASISGNALASLGLSACAETAGTGCAFAIIGKVLAVVGIIGTGVADSNKTQEVRTVRNSIAAIRSKLAGTTAQASAVRNSMVDEATRICADVKANCL